MAGMQSTDSGDFLHSFQLESKGLLIGVNSIEPIKNTSPSHSSCATLWAQHDGQAFARICVLPEKLP